MKEEALAGPKDAALKLALEALNWSTRHEGAVITHGEAITAIKEALAQPAQQEPLTPEWCADWIRNNYQDYWNIATLCDEMTKAAHNIKETTE